MPKITLVPTSHVARESLENVRKAIEEEKPECVAVELDVNRYYYIKERGGAGPMDMVGALGIPTFLIYWILKKFQDYFGRRTGILPGSEMIEAVRIAREKGSDVALIDQRIEVTLYKLRKISLMGKLKLFKLMAMGMFGLAFPFGRGEKIDLNRVPPKKLVRQAMDYMKKELPEFYRVLVGQRNAVMARNLKHLSEKYDSVVCVIGAGHEEGIRKLLK